MPALHPSDPDATASGTRSSTPFRRVLGALSIVAIAVAVIGLLSGWPHVWAACLIAGVLMLIDLRLIALNRPKRVPKDPSLVRRRTIAPILLGLALIAIAIAASLFEGWGWRFVGVASLVAFALMTLISLPMLAASAHDRGARAEAHAAVPPTAPDRRAPAEPRAAAPPAATRR